jgi:hypothetical protein
MLESQFLCLAVSRRDGGNCIAGIDLDSEKWIRPVRASNRGALGDHEIVVRDAVTQELRILAPLDVLHLRLAGRVASRVQPENFELATQPHGDVYHVLRRFDARLDRKMLDSRVDKNGPLLHSYSDRIRADDPQLMHGLSHTLSIVEPQQLHWRVAPHPIYPRKLKVQADFRHDGAPYCLVVTDPTWEERCRHVIAGRHSHAAIAGEEHEQVLLTISLAEVPLHGYHFKLVVAVIHLPA